MQIVTSGFPFLDIDAYGGIVAYAELLQKLGLEVKAISSSLLNESITSEIRSWNAPMARNYEPSGSDRFTVIDVSDPEHFDPIVTLTHVTRIIDHHPGFEARWANLGEEANIEFIGAACTLVYEQWLKAGKISEMSDVSARLLATGILDNTLNFNAVVTTDRDHVAYNDLIGRARLQYDDWPAEYFMQCQTGIEADLATALRNDTKIMAAHAYLPRAFGQLVVWNAKDLLTNRRAEMASTLKEMDKDWAINVVSIEEGKSYFVADNPMTQTKFGELMGLDLSSGTASADRLWLRKEILKRAQERQ